MAKQYTPQDNEPLMANEDMVAYPQGVTIPITLPTTGDYSVEFLKKELTDFAMSLLRKAKPADMVSRTNWRDIQISDNVKSMTVGVSSLSSDTRTDKELLIEALDEKYR